jgi:hypothetical protein
MSVLIFSEFPKKSGMIQSLGNKINFHSTCHSVDSAESGVTAEVFSEAARNIMGQTDGKIQLKFMEQICAHVKHV